MHPPPTVLPFHPMWSRDASRMVSQITEGNVSCSSPLSGPLSHNASYGLQQFPRLLCTAHAGIQGSRAKRTRPPPMQTLTSVMPLLVADVVLVARRSLTIGRLSSFSPVASRPSHGDSLQTENQRICTTSPIYPASSPSSSGLSHTSLVRRSLTRPGTSRGA